MIQVGKYSAVVISAFPGCGKSVAYMALNKKIKVIDSDSSTFDKTDFPNNYISHIKENFYNYDIIFVSSHESVRHALKENKIPFILYYPNKERKKEFLENYHNRGNDKKFIDFLNNNFERFIDEIEEEDDYLKIELKDEGDFIMNNDFFNTVLKNIKNG